MFWRALYSVVLASVVLACAVTPATARDAHQAQAARVADPATVVVTFTPGLTIVRYANALPVSGYVTSAGEPVAGTVVTLHETRDGVTRDGGTAVTDNQGFYQTTVTPRFNASWHAEAAGVSSLPVVVQVRPRVTLALAHTQSGTRLTEVFSGAVTPRHEGKRVIVQRRTTKGWRAVASGRLDRRSHYRIRWQMPYRSATYRLRVLLPAHDDHADGPSPTAFVRVRVGG